ncbi:MAG: hypothetical protein ACRDTG_29675 [Pseudonocardiaceae bacterium]
MIANATMYRRHQRHPDRVLFTDRTDGGTCVALVARYDSARHLIRPITA